jgi:hypothetical protein
VVGGRSLPIRRVKRQVLHDPEYSTTFVRRTYKPRASAPRPSLKGAGRNLDTERILFEVTYYYPIVLTRGYSPQNGRYPCTDIIMQRMPAAKALLRRGFSEAAWKEIAVACDAVHGIFRGQPVELLADLIVLFIGDSWTNHNDLYVEITGYFARAAKIIMGERHPIANILTMMGKIENRMGMGEVVLRAMLDLIKSNKDRMVRMRPCDIYRLESQYLLIVGQTFSLETLQERMEGKLAEWQERHGPRNQYVLAMKGSLVNIYQRLNLPDKADEYLNEIVNQGRAFSKDASLFGTYPSSASDLAKIHFRKGRYADAQECLSLAASWLENRRVAEHYLCVDIGQQLAALEWMSNKGLIDLPFRSKEITQEDDVADADKEFSGPNVDGSLGDNLPITSSNQDELAVQNSGIIMEAPQAPDTSRYNGELLQTDVDINWPEEYQ